MFGKFIPVLATLCDRFGVVRSFVRCMSIFRPFSRCKFSFIKVKHIDEYFSISYCPRLPFHLESYFVEINSTKVN